MTQNALKYFQEIIKQNPDTRRASSAQAYIDAINSGQDILDADGNRRRPPEAVKKMRRADPGKNLSRVTKKTKEARKRIQVRGRLSHRSGK